MIRWSNRPSCGLLGSGEPRCEWLSKEGTQCGSVISNVLLHLLWSKMFQFDIDGVLYSFFKPAVFSDQDASLLSSKEFFSFRCKWTAESWPEELPSCVVTFVERMFCLTSVQMCTVLSALMSINYIILFMPGCFVLRMDNFLPQCVGRFEVNQDMIFIEDPPEFLRCNIRTDDVTFFRLLLSVCSGSFRGFDKGPVLVTTGFKCSPDVLLFLLLPLCLCGHGLSLMV